MAKSTQTVGLSLAAVNALAREAGSDPTALLQLARHLTAPDDQERAQELVHKALELAPDDDRIRTLAAQTLSRGVPQWHFSIVQDDARNVAYDRAIRRAVQPGSRVLDIGTGSGLLAMMAARAGAAEVTGCEMNPALARAAAENIRRNDYAAKIRVLGKHSSEVCLDELGGHRADVLVSETISNDVLGQDWLATLQDVVPRLCTASVAVIPAKTTVRVALGFDQEWARKQVGIVAGFDLSAINALRHDRYQIKPDDPRVLLRSRPSDLFEFDFSNASSWSPQTAEVALEGEGPGPINGIVQWISIQLDAETNYENRPGSSSCWALLFYPFASAVENPPADSVRVKASHDLRRLTLWLA